MLIKHISDEIQKGRKLCNSMLSPGRHIGLEADSYDNRMAEEISILM